jgi:serine O-acetyltransferase
MDIKGITLIKNKHDYLFYLNSDKFALGINDKFILKIKRFFYPNYIYNFQKLMRKAEYYKNCKKGLFNKLIYAIIYKRYMNLSVKLGFSIPLNVFGPGLAIAHYGTIIVNHAAKIGVNCRLHADVNIGASNGSKIAPIIGDNCYIAPGVKIFGEIIIAKNTAISANSVVNKSIEESGFMVAGIPAKKIKEYDIENVILFSKQAVEEGLERDYSCSKKEQNTIILNKINKKVNK